MELVRPCSNFQSDLDFCPDCGSVLPLPGVQDTVICPRCGFSIDVRDFGGKVVKTSVVFNKLGAVIPMSVDEGAESQGPVVDRRCSRCGHEGMAYHTRQMRSADEGQTVFYTCINCKFQEKEDSWPFFLATQQQSFPPLGREDTGLWGLLGLLRLPCFVFRMRSSTQSAPSPCGIY